MVTWFSTRMLRPVSWGKERLRNWLFTCKRIKVDSYLTPFTKINSKWIKDTYARAETINLLEENTDVNLDRGLGSGFLRVSPKNISKKRKK